jgi:tetratricopeptide (TPR) repeat protein
MKKITMVLSSLLIAATMNAQVKMPAPSPGQTIKQDFALGTIEVKYSRPVAKGRKVFGDLVPFNKLWRTGANAATIIKFTDAVEIKGKRIDTGSYALYTIPGTDTWEIILNKGLTNWGVDGYKESEDVVRVKVKPEITSNNTETLIIGIGDITPESAAIYLKWATTLVAVPIKTDIKSTIRSQIEASTTGTAANGAAYQAAANFYYDMDKDYDKALVFVDKAIALDAKAYWLFLLKAKTQKELGDKKGAKASAEICIKMAEAGKNADYVRSATELIASL